MHALTSVRLIASVAIGWVIVSVIISAARRDWTWFGRAGSILALSGGLLAARMLLRLGAAGVYTAQHTLDGGHFIPTTAEQQAAYQSALDVHASAIGFWFIVLGTIIWGYGDLIGHVFPRRTPTPNQAMQTGYDWWQVF